jgi:SAM-dependent methyltransferase
MSRPEELRLALRSMNARLRSRIASTYRPILYHGDRFSCPCCGGRFARFVTHRGRPNVRCPRCGSMERHRVLALWMSEQSWLRHDGLRILHIAPERALVPMLQRLGGASYTSGDLFSPLADERIDVMDIPYPAASFDLIVCNHVLEHVTDDLQAMRELRRVITPDGHAILMAPIAYGRTTTLEDPDISSAFDRLAAYGQEDHARLYGTDYVERLESVGFNVTVERPAMKLSPVLVSRARLHAEHPVFDENDVIVAVPELGDAGNAGAQTPRESSSR